MTPDEIGDSRAIIAMATPGPWWDAREWFQSRHAQRINPREPGPLAKVWRAKPGMSIRDTWALLICAPSNCNYGVRAVGGSIPPKTKNWQEHKDLNAPCIGVGEFDFAHVVGLRWSSMRGDSWGTSPLSDNDAQFICHARTALPSAIDEIERLRRLVVDLGGSP